MKRTVRSKDFEAMIMANPDAIFILDREGLTKFVNPAAESLFNLPASELMGVMVGGK